MCLVALSFWDGPLYSNYLLLSTFPAAYFPTRHHWTCLLPNVWSACTGFGVYMLPAATKIDLVVYTPFHALSPACCTVVWHGRRCSVFPVALSPKIFKISDLRHHLLTPGLLSSVMQAWPIFASTSNYCSLFLHGFCTACKNFSKPGCNQKLSTFLKELTLCKRGCTCWPLQQWTWNFTIPLKWRFLNFLSHFTDPKWK